MATEKIILHIDGSPVEVTLRSARKTDGLRRAGLMIEATKQEGDELDKQVAFYQYPTCVSSVESPAEVRELSFGDFLARVDEEDIENWMNVAYKLNPQWVKSMNMLRGLTDEDEKKTGTLSTGSNTPTEDPQTTPSETSPASTS